MMTQAPAHERVLIVDFGSQVTQLIARRLRESGVYCEIHPFDKVEAMLDAFAPKAVILSGGPASAHEDDSPAAPHEIAALLLVDKLRVEKLRFEDLRRDTDTGASGYIACGIRAALKSPYDCVCDRTDVLVFGVTQDQHLERGSSDL